MLVLHLITGLNVGGAELMLYQLLSNPDVAGFQSRVISLLPFGAVGENIRKLGIPVETIGMTRGLPNPFTILRLAARLRRERPAVVQTWMYHADLMGGSASRLPGIRAAAWGIHNSHLTRRVNKGTTLLTARLCARLSGRLPKRIVCVSEAARR